MAKRAMVTADQAGVDAAAIFAARAPLSGVWSHGYYAESASTIRLALAVFARAVNGSDRGRIQAYKFCHLLVCQSVPNMLMLNKQQLTAQKTKNLPKLLVTPR